MAKTKTIYVCQACGVTSPKWVGRCPSCGEWNTYIEELEVTGGKSTSSPANISLLQKPLMLS
ncbi:MAG TPA: DNA repair protein RadA, partial [Prolixibacteraceae bacterium]|nr:DNA repair protein RadA [Prolixibacteraceae bacterium]